MSFLAEFMDVDKSRKVKLDEFLNFITEKRSAGTTENLCVMYITVIQEARQFETSTVNKYIRIVKKKSSKNIRSRPLLSAEKKQLDEHFYAMSERIKSFSSAKEFCGKHVRFLSSSESESKHRIRWSDIPTTCPYPSASEEMKRLGLKTEDDSGLLTTSGSDRYSKDIRQFKSKRKHDDVQSSMALPKKVPKRDVVTHRTKKGSKLSQTCNKESDGSNDSSHGDGSIKSFVNTWKEACRTTNVDEVFQRMLQFYHARKKNKMTKLFSSYPFCGLLQVAVASIKREMWDSMYDKLQTFQLCGVTKRGAENCADSICIEVESPERDATNLSKKLLVCENGVTIEDILGKVITYFEGDDDAMSTASSYHEKFFLLNKFLKLESWLITQFAVEKFESLGYGDIWHFLEKNMHLFSHTLPRCLTYDMHKKPHLEPPSMLDYQFDLLLSQASQCLWESEKVDKRRISELLMRQFPLVCFKVAGSDTMIDIENFMKAKRANMTSKSVVFSETLLKASAMGKHKEHISRETGLVDDVGHGDWILMSKDAMKVLVNAPMLIDLKLWSHWDMVFAPSLVDWLLKDVKTEELLCLVTTCGKLFRVDHSATVESFVNVLLQGNPFDTTVKFVSLLVLYGGEKKVPNSLLKCHARQAFEVLIKNYEEMKSHNIPDSLKHVTSLCRQLIHDETASTMNKKPLRRDRVGKIVPLVSRFILDCLGYLPVEFCHFAADILLAGVQPFVKDAPLAILGKCERIEQRLMLHRVGMSLGIVEWVEDKHKLSACADSNLLMSSGLLCLKVTELDFSRDSTFMEEVSSKYPLSGSKTSLSQDPPRENENRDASCSAGVIFVKIRQLNLTQPQKLAHEGRIAQVHINKPPVHSPSPTNVRLLPTPTSPFTPGAHPERGTGSPNGNEPSSIPCKDTAPSLTQPQKLAHEGRIAQVHINKPPVHSPSPTNVILLPTPIISYVPLDNSADSANQYSYELESSAARVIKSIQQEEFGLQSDLPLVENAILNKQHARLGRALYCLSQELYSHDSHFILELVQNADDNIYPEGVEPTLSFILQDKGIIVLNNERGFSADNIRALCDVGNSTKKGRNAGYIGKKGIGFKSVFRVTDAPEIHSNGFHIKFDITNGQIGFVLPTVVPPCDIDLYTRLGSSGSDFHYLNTCIENIMSMFADLHPSLLLFLHRLHCIQFRNMVNDSILVMRKEVMGNGIIKISFGEEKLTCFVVSQKLRADIIRPDTRTTEISIAFMLQETLDGSYNPHLDQQPVFAFLPLRKYGLKFILQGDFVLPSSREEVDGDSPWNQWLLSEFSSLPRMILSRLRTSNCLIMEGMENEWVPPCKVLRNWTQEARNLLPDRMVMCVVKHSDFVIELHLMKDLKNIPFIPLSDGKYGSLNEGTIWLHVDSMGTSINDEYGLETFSILYSMLRTVSPALLSAATALGTSCPESSIADNVTRMLYRVGVQCLSAHQIVKTHILPFLCRDQNGQGHREIMTEYLAFLMFHLQSSCPDCQSERDQIIREVRNNAFILTNHGCKCPVEFPIHFSKEFENPIDMSKLILALDFEWHEIEDIYLKHPINKLLSEGVSKWRKFFQEIGITDFVRVVQVEKSISDVCSAHMNATWDKDVISRDWMSEEFVDLLSRLSSASDKEKSKYLLEVVDSLWDDNYSDKVTGFYFTSTGERKSFDSSFTKILRDAQWIASSMNNELHFPRELFHDCEAVRSIFGDNAPYAIPKAFTVDDTLAILKVWRAKVPLSASLSQMSRFYTFIWSRMKTSERKLLEELCNGPFVFVPCKLVASVEDVVPGVLLSSKEVFWHDSTGSVDLVKMVCPEFDPHSFQHPFTKMLCSVYPTLHDFFVKECGVDELPHFHGYLQILLQLSAGALPSQGAKNVFHVFIKWIDELNLGSLRSVDISFLKEGLMTKDYLVLPTAEDKWVSLHPSFGLICWCDDDNLRKEFQYFDNIKFLHFGKLNVEEKEILRTKVSMFMHKLNIPSLSKVVTREAIYDGPTDSSLVASMINWVLPYAQRYIYNFHPDKYLQLSQSGFQNLSCLQIVVVEKLFYRNVIRSSHIASKKRFECSCLLEGNILYASQESDSHSIFMEISRLLFSGTPDLHLANFLHMIRTMAESGSNEEQTEFFIVNSQKMLKLSASESVWSLANVSLSTNGEPLLMGSSIITDEKNNVKIKNWPGISSNWPPNDWKTAPGFGIKSNKKTLEECVLKTCALAPTHMTSMENAATYPASSAAVLGSQDVYHVCNVLVPGTMKQASNYPHPMTEPQDLNYSSFDVTERDQLYIGTNDKTDILKETGRLGEYFAFKYFLEKFGEPFVKWVNETNESGLPYDLVVGDDEYIEIKATRSATKDWFHITSRECQFAIEKGESVVTVYKNPFKLYQLGKLHLALLISKSRYFIRCT
ncbi:unnamed protein product [Withania somnifera]